MLFDKNDEEVNDGEVKYLICIFGEEPFPKKTRIDEKSLLRGWPEWNYVSIYKYEGDDVIKIERDNTLDYELFDSN